MAKSLEELRADLARDMGLFFTGVANANAVVTTIADAEGLARFTEVNTFRGGLAYIRTDAGGLGAAPEGEARYVTASSVAALTVEYGFTVAVTTDDVYEVYRAPLSLEQWNKAVNEAIESAWPEVWARRLYEVAPTGNPWVALPDDAHDILSVHIRADGILAGWPDTPVPRAMWFLDGQPGTDLTLRLHHTFDPQERLLRIYYKSRYPALAMGEETDLDYPYVMAAAKANAYEMLAGEAGGQADSSRYLQLLNYWRAEAERRKSVLQAQLLGVVPQAERKK